MNREEQFEQLAIASHFCAWQIVWLVENGHLDDKTSLKGAFDYLSAYADRYSDENCRFRAQKLKNQTN